MDKKNIVLWTIIITVIIGLSFYIEQEDRDDNVVMYRAQVIEVDDSEVVIAGVSAIGSQSVRVKILNKDRKGEIVIADNLLLGQLDFDQLYKEKDIIIIALRKDLKKITYVRCVELYRLNYLLGLFLFFVIVLIVYARLVGLRALLSFIATFFILFKVLIPLLLSGYNPIVLATITLALITGVIVFSVAGFTIKGYTAFMGTVLGLSLTLLMTLIIGDRLGLLGMTAPYAQAIYFGGNFHLDMNQIFYASIMIGSSGAAMDIAMDVSSSLSEIAALKPRVSRKELEKSGFNIGRDVIGTMTTTLLLAYSGGYLTLLMMFEIKGTHLMQLLNMKIVFAELLRILVGSLGLLFVAPLTALIGSYLIDRKREIKN